MEQYSRWNNLEIQGVCERFDKNIIVKFVTRKVKEDILTAARNKRTSLGISGRGLPIDGVSNNVFFNEHLTPENKHFVRTGLQF